MTDEPHEPEITLKELAAIIMVMTELPADVLVEAAYRVADRTNISFDKVMEAFNGGIHVLSQYVRDEGVALIREGFKVVDGGKKDEH